MYLGGKSGLRYVKRGKRTRWGRVAVLSAAIAGLLYFHQFVVPTIPPPFQPTPTVTRGPASYVEEAEANYAAGRLVEAIAAYQQAIRLDPRNVAYHVAMAHAQVYHREPAAALETANTALLIDSDNSDAHAARALALNWLGAHAEAADAAVRALRLNPNNARAHAIYAGILVDQQQWAQAADEARLSLSLDPGSLEGHRAYGYLLESVGDYQGALEQYQAAVGAHPNLSLSYEAVGRVYGYGLGDPNTAIENLQKAAAVDPTNPDIYRQIARMYSGLGEYGKASQYAVQALQIAPQSARAHGLVGVMRYHNREYALAEVSLRLAVEGGVTPDGEVPGGLMVDPIPLDAREAPEAYYTYGMNQMRLERCAQAIPIFNVILNTWPNNDVAVFNANEGLRLCAEAEAAEETAGTAEAEGTEAAPEGTAPASEDMLSATEPAPEP